MNPLERSGKPLFFKAAGGGGYAFQAPAIRHGVSIRTTARSLSVMQKEALVTSSAHGTTWRVASDEGLYLMGDDVAPCPLAHMTVGMVACFMEVALLLAAERGIALRNVRLIQDNYYTMQGSALRGTMTGGALPVELSVQADSGSSATVIEELFNEAVRRAPINALIENVLSSRFTLTHNGREIPTGRVASIGIAAPEFPRDSFDPAKPAAGDWSRLITRDGMSPETDEITSSNGSSYAAEQSRRLHVRGICTLRPDGLKTIEQQLLNPHGSIFHFICEEETKGGGGGRAPDAMSFVSAGIAFCFMTQIGRYAKILKRKLGEYSIVQETHFSSLGQEGEGVADPVETHVHLVSEEDDEFAREALDMSEQTCFLHGLCRSNMNVNLKFVQPDSQVAELSG